jgi:hypothetical protein
MKVSESTPFWVKLVYANVPTRKMALMLSLTCSIFALFCVPWASMSQNILLTKLTVVDDWGWFVMLLPMSAWYWLSLLWVDKNNAWEA